MEIGSENKNLTQNMMTLTKLYRISIIRSLSFNPYFLFRQSLDGIDSVS